MTSKPKGLDRTRFSRRPTVTVNPVTGGAGRDQGV